MNVYDIVDGTTWNIDTKLSTTYTFDKYYVNPATGTANTALILVNGPEGEALYRVVGQNGGFEYYSLDKIDPNTGLLLTGTGTVPDYTQDVNGNFYKNNVQYISDNPLAFKPQTFTTTLHATIPDLTGRVDTNATFDSISKVPLPKTTLDSSEYGPWIWNNAQANNFTGSGIDAKYFHQHEVENVPVEGGTEETTTIKENDYLLLGWQINVKNVSGNQPWLFLLDETALVGETECGEVVQIRFRNLNNTGSTLCRKATADDFADLTEEQYSSYGLSNTSYADFMQHVAEGKIWIAADSDEENRRFYGIGENVENGAQYNFRYDVIVAYPTLNNDNTPNTTVTNLRHVTKDSSGAYKVTYGSVTTENNSGFDNKATAYMFPEDAGKDTVTPVTGKTAVGSASAGYQAFQFTYGNASQPEFNKWSDKNYQGWLSSYDLNNTVPEFVFRVNASVNDASSTHNGADLNGNTIELVTVDDKVIGQAIAYKSTDGTKLKSIPVLLDADDYYYNSLTLSVRERDLNKADGTYTVVNTKTHTQADLDWHLYYMEKGDEEWKEYKVDGSKPVFTMEEYISNPPSKPEDFKTIPIDLKNLKPYRVKLVHETEIGISDMNMTLKMTPVQDETSAFKIGKALRTLYAENDLTTSYGSYGEEIYGFNLAIDNYAGYRPRLKEYTSTGSSYTRDLLDIHGTGDYNYINQYGFRPNHSEYRGWSAETDSAVPYYGTTDEGSVSDDPVNNTGEIELSVADYDTGTNHQNTRLIRAIAKVTTLDKNAGAEKYAQAVNYDMSFGLIKKKKIKYL